MIKKWLWPHKKNKYRPYALRPLGLAIFLFIIVAMPFVYNVTLTHKPQVLGYATDISPAQLYSLTNSERESAGVPDLSLNAQLVTAAQNKADDMFANDYWAHVSPSGVQPWTFITNAGYSYSIAAENLAKDFLTSEGVITGWMDSPDHRTNMLNPAYKDVGFAVENGTLLGSQTTLVVAMYASPAYTPAPVQRVSTTPPPSTPTATTPASTTPTTSSAPTPAAATTSVLDKKSKIATKTKSIRGLNGVSGTKPSLGSMIVNVGALNWGQKVTIFLASSLMLASLAAHTAVWRLKKQGRHHIWLRAHPMMQASLLLVISLVTITSGFGVVK